MAKKRQEEEWKQDRGQLMAGALTGIFAPLQVVVMQITLQVIQSIFQA